MSTHPRDDLLAAAVDGTLSPADRREVEAHLRTCSGCRGDVAAAGRARDALGALPDQLVPPVDVAAAVAGAAAGAGAGAPQRWYRAAALVAAAAAIALAVLVIPDLTNDGGSQETTAAVGAAPREAGVSAADGSASPVPFAGVPSLEVVGIDFDHASLAALAQRGGAAVSTSGEATPQTPVVGMSGEEALACVRAGAAGTIPPDARVERLLAATFGGTPAYIGVVAPGPADDPAGILVVAVATDGCRLLDSA
jgi:anti-sigma factor RsiW